MNRTLTFEFITDNRFPEKYGTDIVSKIKEYISKMENILIENKADYEIRPIFELTFDTENNKQQRCRFYVKKIKGLTWKEHYILINSVQPCVYKLI